MEPRCRIAMYSHDTMGLGHTRRNLLIAQALAGSHLKASVLMLTGSCESIAFSMTSGVDCVALPALRKGLDGQYRPRRMDIPLEELVALRSRTIAATLEAFAPDVLIVDKVPRGALGELDPVLDPLRRRGTTRCVLGLRDILDDRETAIREWSDMRNDVAVRDFYDAVWVYGDPAVFDPAREYGFSPEVAAKVRHTGYLDQSRWLRLDPGDKDGAAEAIPSVDGRVILCLLGGGEDGATLAEAFVRTEFPSDATGVLLTGPLMPAENRRRLKEFAAGRPRLRVIEFHPRPPLLIARAERVIAMGGYNVVGEVLAFEKPALIVPRVKPRTEQLIRAGRLKELGLVDLLHPDDLSPRALTEWVGRDVSPPRVRDRIDLNGLSRIPRLLEGILPAKADRAREGVPWEKVFLLAASIADWIPWEEAIAIGV